MDHYSSYYNLLNKPSFAPPEWVFGIAWSIIYPMIAVAAIYLCYLIYKDRHQDTVKLMTVFVINMIGNVLFTPLLFGLQSNILASFDIILVFATLGWFEMVAWKQSKILFFIMLPYFIWIIFATFLQLVITWMNVYNI